MMSATPSILRDPQKRECLREQLGAQFRSGSMEQLCSKRSQRVAIQLLDDPDDLSRRVLIPVSNDLAPILGRSGHDILHGLPHQGPQQFVQAISLGVTHGDSVGRTDRAGPSRTRHLIGAKRPFS
jgi:hypothetical protein